MTGLRSNLCFHSLSVFCLDQNLFPSGYEFSTILQHFRKVHRYNNEFRAFRRNIITILFYPLLKDHEPWTHRAALYFRAIVWFQNVSSRETPETWPSQHFHQLIRSLISFGKRKPRRVILTPYVVTDIFSELRSKSDSVHLFIIENICWIRWSCRISSPNFTRHGYFLASSPIITILTGFCTDCWTLTYNESWIFSNNWSQHCQHVVTT